MAALFNDGSIPYGSRIITSNSVDYIAENIEVNRPTKIITRENELGEPSGQVIVSDFVTGSATLQISATGTARPVLGNTFTETFDSVIGSETFIITSVSTPEAQGDAIKVSIEFRKKYNA